MGAEPANLIPTVQQAITQLLTTYEPEFLRFGWNLFLSFAAILIAWQGIKMMFAGDGLGDQMFDFARLLMFLSFGYALIVFYETPLPGIGVSFSNLITDQTNYFQNVLETHAIESVYGHLDALSRRFLRPNAWAILANLLYWVFLVIIALAKLLSLAVICFGMIASAVCGLLGPIFVPFFIVPKLDWLFWSWLKAFIQYSFVPVVAIAFLMVFEKFLYRYLTTLPPALTEVEQGTYVLQAIAVLGTFCLGMVLVPSLTRSIFTGSGGESVLSPLCRHVSCEVVEVMARRFPRDDRPFNPDEVATPGVMRAVIYLVAFAALIGFVCGIVWIIWQLLRVHVLP